MAALFDEGLSQCADSIKPAATSPTAAVAGGLDAAVFGLDDSSCSADGLSWQDLSAVPSYDASLKEGLKVASAEPFDWTRLSLGAENAAVQVRANHKTLPRNLSDVGMGGFCAGVLAERGARGVHAIGDG